MIRTEALRKIYRTEEIETTALDDVDLEVAAGEFVAVVGPSGCGKTTLLNVLGLLDRPSAGRYRFLDRDVSRLPERERAAIRRSHVGFVFQSFHLVEELTVFENVELPLRYLGRPPAERKRAVEEALEAMEIVPRRNHYPPQLSGGQQQRAAVARAVVTKPEVLFADEPTGNLDSSRGDEVMRLLARLNAGGTTIVMVTHSPAYAEYAHRTLRLIDGRIVADEHREVSRAAR